MDVVLYNGTSIEDLGLWPSFFSDMSPLSAREQADRNYSHGGGWSPMQGFKLTSNDLLLYPGDPPLRKRAEIHLRNERIILYESDFVAIIQPDRSFEASRMD